MKIVFISDTHGGHHDVILPDGDILIHAGDISPRGREVEIDDFLNWFEKQPYQYKIFIAGNHDYFFEKENEIVISNKVPKSITYLNDSGCEIEGLKIWGSPIQPVFMDWAFNRNRGEEIEKHWNLIPNDTNILITHGPPYGILDKTAHGDSVGCNELKKKILKIKPKIHVFGHIHEGYGIHQTKDTIFINASVLNHRYYLTNDPVVIEI